MSELNEQEQFVLDLVKMKDRAGRIGLYKTMHALDKATKQIGYEIAELKLIRLNGLKKTLKETKDLRKKVSKKKTRKK